MYVIGLDTASSICFNQCNPIQYYDCSEEKSNKKKKTKNQ
jgi:hypothetical protein